MTTLLYLLIVSATMITPSVYGSERKENGDLLAEVKKIAEALKRVTVDLKNAGEDREVSASLNEQRKDLGDVYAKVVDKQLEKAGVANQLYWQAYHMRLFQLETYKDTAMQEMGRYYREIGPADRPEYQTKILHEKCAEQARTCRKWQQARALCGQFHLTNKPRFNECSTPDLCSSIRGTMRRDWMFADQTMGAQLDKALAIFDQTDDLAKAIEVLTESADATPVTTIAPASDRKN